MVSNASRRFLFATSSKGFEESTGGMSVASACFATTSLSAAVAIVFGTFSRICGRSTRPFASVPSFLVASSVSAADPGSNSTNARSSPPPNSAPIAANGAVTIFVSTVTTAFQIRVADGGGDQEARHARERPGRATANPAERAEYDRDRGRQRRRREAGAGHAHPAGRLFEALRRRGEEEAPRGVRDHLSRAPQDHAGLSGRAAGLEGPEPRRAPGLRAVRAAAESETHARRARGPGSAARERRARRPALEQGAQPRAHLHRGESHGSRLQGLGAHGDEAPVIPNRGAPRRRLAQRRQRL